MPKLIFLRIFLFSVFSLLILPSQLISENIRSDMVSANKTKVIVTFNDEIQPEIVEKYGRVLRTLKIINGVVAVTDTMHLDTLKDEASVSKVAIDFKIGIPERTQTGFGVYESKREKQ